MGTKTVQRLFFIDAAKAIGIVLVVFGHKEGLPEFLINIIYSFHMPLFFFLAGYLVSNSKLAKNFKDYFLNKVNTLVVPYFLFGIFSIFFYYLKNHNLNLLVEIKPWIGLLYGNGDMLYFNVALWFFTCLFMTSIIYYLFRQKFNSIQTVFIALILGLLVSSFSEDNLYRFPWNFELSFVALFFYSFGQWISAFDVKNIFSKNKRTILKIFFFGIVIFLVSNFFLKRVDMNTMLFGNPIVFYAMALLGIFLTLVVSLLLKENRFLSFLGKNTMIIFPLHLILFSMFSGVGIIIFNQVSGFQNTMYYAVIYTTAVFVLTYPLSYFFKRYCPICIGVKIKRNSKK